ncbi:tRNAHis guanylyltransferase-domain-containing protein [Mrakia frigida]|uniref:tRNA guanylyltransferase n=1 Tax=Mrakia frigida TaxID=29902 RepID=UPI003FCBF744
MSNSKYEYVRSYEKPDGLLPNTFLLLRIDGHAFHKFSDLHEFKKPNDLRALELMDRAAKTVMDEYPDVVLGFGESDEYSFLIRRAGTLYSRRESKIVSLLVSLFTSAYVYHWTTYFPPSIEEPLGKKLLYPPTFDGRIVCYPSEKEVRDYFSWRQVDTHINNLYNTTFWSLVLLSEPKMTTAQAHKELQGSFSKDKNEILFKRFGISYGKLEERFKKGSVMIREETPVASTSTASQAVEPIALSTERSEEKTSTSTPLDSSLSTLSLNPPSNLDASEPSSSPTPVHPPRRTNRKEKPPLLQDGTRGKVVVLHVDIIKDEFWNERRWLLA